MIPEELSLEFVRSHAGDSVPELKMKYAGRVEHLDFLLTQIEARRKTSRKLRRVLERNPDFLFPTLLSSEQASDELTAMFHSTFVSEGDRVIDLTAGLGIDASALMDKGAEVTACERDPLLAEALEHNWPGLEVVNADSLQYLAGSAERYDLIFADPARRGDNDRRLYALSDCIPDIAANFEMLRSHARRLLVKASPMLDPMQIIRELPRVDRLMSVSVRGECKEMLIYADFDAPQSETMLEAVNVTADGDVQRYRIDTNAAEIRYAAAPMRYLYEPGAAVMKFNSGPSLCASFPDIRQADASTRLYLSDTLYPDFPGRILEVEREVKIKERGLKGTHANIVSRNHPLSPQQLKSRLQTLDGGSDYIYALRLGGKNVILKCRQMNI